MPKDEKLDPKRVDQIKKVHFQQTRCLEFTGKKGSYLLIHVGFASEPNVTAIYNLLRYKPKSTTSVADVVKRAVTVEEAKDIIEELEELL